MESILANLMKVQGVLAGAVFTLDDSCLEFAASEPVFEPIMLLAAAKAAEDGLDVFRTAERLTDGFSITCELEHGVFAYRNLGSTRLAVMAATGVNVAMLDVAIGVASLKLAQLDQRRGPSSSNSTEYSVPQAPRPSAMHGVPTAIGSYPSAPSAVPAYAAPPPAPARRHPATLPPPTPPISLRGQATGSQPLAPSPAPATSSGMSPSMAYEDWRHDELLANGSRVPGTIGPAVMQHLLRTLVRYLGGHAKAVIVEELASLGATPATARADIFTDLIYNLADRIPDPSVHGEFVKLVLGDR